MYKQYIKDINYVRYYRLAAELAVVYLMALYEAYYVLKRSKDFNDKHRKRFLAIVSDADLSYPLKQKVFDKARAELRNKRHMETAVAAHASGLLTKTKLLTANRIFNSSNDKDVLSV